MPPTNKVHVFTAVRASVNHGHFAILFVYLCQYGFNNYVENMMQGLTKREKAVLDLIRDHLHANFHSPSIRELCELSGTASIGIMHEHLLSLERKGFIRRNDTRRQIFLCECVCPHCGRGNLIEQDEALDVLKKLDEAITFYSEKIGNGEHEITLDALGAMAFCKRTANLIRRLIRSNGEKPDAQKQQTG